jgi:hypothetical protein
MEELSPSVCAKTKVVVKLVGPREVVIRCEDHVGRILRLLTKMKATEVAG